MIQLTVSLRPTDDPAPLEQAFERIGQAYDGSSALQRTHQVIEFTHEHPGAIILARLVWLNSEGTGGQAHIAPPMNGQRAAVAAKDRSGTRAGVPMERSG